MACTRNDRFSRAHLAHGALRRGRTACAPRFRFRRNGAPVPEIGVRIGKLPWTAWLGRSTATGAFSIGCVGNKGLRIGSSNATLFITKNREFAREFGYC